MSDNLYEGPCEAGCQRFHGGETRHDKCCGYYPESLTKAFEDKIETLTARIRELEQGVGVKPLEWKDNKASTPFGDYSIHQTPDGYEVIDPEGEEIVHVGFNSDPIRSAYRLAQEFVQADYEQRIRSTLTPAPVTKGFYSGGMWIQITDDGTCETPTPAPVTDEARENIVDEIEEIVAETHDLDVTDRNYAENIVGWLERHHPAALSALAGQGGEA